MPSDLNFELLQQDLNDLGWTQPTPPPAAVPAFDPGIFGVEDMTTATAPQTAVPDTSNFITWQQMQDALVKNRASAEDTQASYESFVNTILPEQLRATGLDVATIVKVQEQFRKDVPKPEVAGLYDRFTARGDELIKSILGVRTPGEGMIDKAQKEQERLNQERRQKIILERRKQQGTDEANPAMRFLNNIRSGVGNSYAGAFEYIGRKAGIEGLEEFGNIMSEQAAALTPTDPDFSDKLVNLGGNILGFAGPAAGVKAGLMAAKAGAVVSSTAAALSAAGIETAGVAQEAYEEALKNTGNKKLAEEQAFLAGTINLPLSYIANKFELFSNAFKGGVPKELVGRLGAAGAAGGVEEGAQNILTKSLGFGDPGEGTTESALLGAIGGTGMRGTVELLQRKTPAPVAPPQTAPMGTVPTGSESTIQQEVLSEIANERQQLENTQNAKGQNPGLNVPQGEGQIPVQPQTVGQEQASVIPPVVEPIAPIEPPAVAPVTTFTPEELKGLGLPANSRPFKQLVGKERNDPAVAEFISEYVIDTAKSNEKYAGILSDYLKANIEQMAAANPQQADTLKIVSDFIGGQNETTATVGQQENQPDVTGYTLPNAPGDQIRGEAGAVSGSRSDPAASAGIAVQQPDSTNSLEGGMEVRQPSSDGQEIANQESATGRDVLPTELKDVNERRDNAENDAITRAIDKATGKPKEQLMYKDRTRVLPRVRKAFARLESSGDKDSFVKDMEYVHELLEGKSADKKFGKNPRVRGAEMIRERAVNAVRKGDMSPEAMSFLTWVLSKNPKAFDSIAISIVKGGENSPRGSYSPANKLVKLFKGNMSDTTAVHEMMHSMEQLMPTDIQKGVRELYLKTLADEYKTAKGKEREYIQAVVSEDTKKAFKMLTDGEVSREKWYQYMNPSEFWAENATAIMQGRFNARDSLIKKIGQWLKEFKDKILAAAGRGNGGLIKVLDDLIASADGQVVSNEMLSRTGGAFNDPDSSTFKKWFGDSKVVDAEGKPLVVYHGSRGIIPDVIKTPYFYMTESKNEARSYSGENVSPRTGETRTGKSRDGGSVGAYYVSLQNPVYLDEHNKYFLEQPDYLKNQIEKWKNEGYDGVIMPWEGGAQDGIRNFIAFSPTQIKSAIGNNGNFDGSNPNILLDPATPPKPEIKTRTNQVTRTRTFDDKVPLQDLMKGMIAAGKTAEAQYINELDQLNRSDASRDIRTIEKQYGQPMLEAVQKTVSKFGKSKAQIEEIINKLHAEGRADYFLSLKEETVPADPNDPNSTSKVIKTVVQQVPELREKARQAKADAVAYLDGIKNTEPEFYKAVVNEIVPAIKDFTDASLDASIQSGLRSATEVARLKQSFPTARTGPFYIPFQTDEDYTSSFAEAKGVNFEGTDPFGRIQTQLVNTINNGYKNKINQQVYALAYKNNIVDEDGKKVIEVAPVPILKKMPDGTIDYGIQNLRNDPDTVLTYIDGKPYSMKVNDGPLREALKGIPVRERAPWVNAAITVSSVLTQLRARTMTGYNPVFALVNGLVRDPGSIAMFLPKDVSAVGVASEWPGSFITALMGESGKFRNKQYPSYQEAQDAGALTDVRRALGYNKISTEFVDEMFPSAKSKGTKALSVTDDVLTYIGNVLENTNRIAVYEGAKKSYMAQGMTADAAKRKAAITAKNTTTNFERSSQYGRNLAPFFLFVNPTLQGSRNLVKNLRGNPRTQAVAGALTIAGLMAGFACKNLSETDADGKSMCEKIPDYKKDNSLYFAEGGAGIPMTPGVNLPWVMGQSLYDYMSGSKPLGEAAARMMKNLVTVFSPIGQPQADPVTSSSMNISEYLIRMLGGATLLQPAVDLAFNKNTFGQTIVPDSQKMKGRADADKYYKNENKASVAAAKGLSDLTGGGIDISPATITYLAKYIGGPVSENAKTIIAGKKENFPGEVTNPLAKRFIMQAVPYEDSRKFNDVATELKGLSEKYKTTPAADRAKFYEKNKELLQLVGVFNAQAANRRELFKGYETRPDNEQTDKAKQLQNKQQIELLGKYYKAKEAVSKRKG